MNCTFLKGGTCQLAYCGGMPSGIYCESCKKNGNDKFTSSRFHAGPAKQNSCAHRGDEIRRVQCQSCTGSVMAKVMACSIHGECTLFSKPIEGVKACAGCSDRI